MTEGALEGDGVGWLVGAGDCDGVLEGCDEGAPEGALEGCDEGASVCTNAHRLNSEVEPSKSAVAVAVTCRPPVVEAGRENSAMPVASQWVPPAWPSFQIMYESIFGSGMVWPGEGESPKYLEFTVQLDELQQSAQDMQFLKSAVPRTPGINETWLDEVLSSDWFLSLFILVSKKVIRRSRAALYPLFRSDRLSSFIHSFSNRKKTI